MGCRIESTIGGATHAIHSQRSPIIQVVEMTTVIVTTN